MLAVKNAYLALLTARAKSVDLDKRVCYLLSFADNDGGAIEGLYQQYGANFLLAYTPQMAEVAASYGVKGVTITPFTLRKLVLGSAWQKIARCQVIIADNYYPELAALSQRQRKIIQIWHATGALKAFGWQDPKTKQRSQADQARFQKVYDSLTDIVVGSRAMGEVFTAAYHINPNRLRYLGAPRTDALQPTKTPKTQSEASSILYVPTYRDSLAEMQAVLTAAFTAFSASDKQVLVKLHPNLAQQLRDLPTPKNVQLVTADLAALFDQSAYLVTDYSSCVFDFLLRRPEQGFCLYCPDVDHYAATTGLQPDFKESWQPWLVQTSEELTAKLQGPHQLRDGASEKLLLAQQALSHKWHEYNTGQARAQLVDLVADYLQA